MSSGGPPASGSRRSVVVRAVFVVWRNRLARFVVSALVAAAILGALALTWLGGKVRSRTCEKWDVVDLTFDEIVALKEKADAYRRDPSPDAALELSEGETNFLLREVLGVEGRAELGQSSLDLAVAVPVETGCYNVRFVGGAKVRRGMLILDPQELRLGELDLRSFLPPRIGLGRAQLRGWVDEKWMGYLENTERLDVDGNRVQVRLRDPDGAW